MAKNGIDQKNTPNGVLTLAEVAEAVERVYGEASVGLVADDAESASEEARATFVRASLLLIAKQRFEALGDLGEDAFRAKFKVNREVREEMVCMLGVDENEVFRLHHHAAGLRAKDRRYREIARTIEGKLAEAHGMGF